MYVLKRFIDIWKPIYLLRHVFQTGVFSATVAAFLIESYKYLKPDPTEVSSRLLQQITQELAGISNGDHLTPPALDTFQVPRYAIHVNILWFLSLCLSLACGLSATLVQQWARRYLRLTRRSDKPERRVRTRAFLYKGITQFHVNWVVENISIILHAAICLFLVGLVEFLFAINDEVADVILVAVSIFVSLYGILTFLPVIFRHCPFQTPLTSILWYIGHILAISSLYPFSCSSRVLRKIKVLQRRLRDGFDLHLMGTMQSKHHLDKDALKSTLRMCRDEGDLEAFVDAIPGYLQQTQTDHDDDGADIKHNRIDDIGSLLHPESKGQDSKEKESLLRHRFVHLFASCTHDHKRMDEGSRRRRAITCSRAIWEMSKASLSAKGKSVAFDLRHLPKSIGETLHRLASDTDSAIAASALRTIAVFKRAIMEARNDPDQSKDSLAALAGIVGGINDSLSLPYQAEPYHDVWPDGRLNTVTEFTSRIAVLIPHMGPPSHIELEETRMTLEELCRGLNGRDFPHADQQRFVDALNDASQVHLASDNAASTGVLCP